MLDFALCFSESAEVALEEALALTEPLATVLFILTVLSRSPALSSKVLIDRGGTLTTKQTNLNSAIGKQQHQMKATHGIKCTQAQLLNPCTQRIVLL